MRNNFMILIFFSSESWDVALFKSDTGRTPGRTRNNLFWFEILKILIFFQNHDVVQNQNSEKGVRLGVLPMWNSKRVTPQLSLEKKINVVTFFDDFLSPSELWRVWRCVDSILRNQIRYVQNREERKKLNAMSNKKWLVWCTVMIQRALYSPEPGMPVDIKSLDFKTASRLRKCVPRRNFYILMFQYPFILWIWCSLEFTF